MWVFDIPLIGAVNTRWRALNRSAVGAAAGISGSMLEALRPDFGIVRESLRSAAGIARVLCSLLARFVASSSFLR